MNLDQWNNRLSSHFAALRCSRQAQRADLPLFALEHGLTPSETQELATAIRDHIRVATPASRHELAWLVYAAEIGYGYAGDEYWQTFEVKTPGWTVYGDRAWLRKAFKNFHHRFRGAVPTGAWAEQFSIICWPITHAILPLDLQQQLARILYELRHSFSAELFESPSRLGEFIALRSWSATSRFQNLAQETALIGQIAAALLLQGDPGIDTLLFPATLQRIWEDVDRERRGREWLRSARRVAQERARIRGLTLAKGNASLAKRPDDARVEVVALGIEPRLVLRPMDAERRCWEVSLEIPDLSHLLLRFPQVREVLTESRCEVAGAAGRPLARGRCLHGPQRVALSRWPRPDDVLLKFERTEPQLEYLLRAECMLRPGSSWLFKVASDGLAYESRGRRVRAETKYVLVSTEPVVDSPLARSVELTCQGVHAVTLDVPSALTQEWEQALRQLQVTQAKSIEVWPAGLAAVAWDGEGHGEWLASETPTLAIRSDHAMDELTIAMDDGRSLTLTLTDTPLGEPIFIELPPLPVGLHRFSVAARSGNGAGSEVIGDLDVVMRVREARPWSPGATVHGPLEMELDPAAPSLEQFWEGKAAVVVRGPAGRQARCRVKMFVRAGEAPSFERQLPPVNLPLSNEEWTRHFETHLKKDKDAPRAYDEAHVCEVEICADELGILTLRCEREFRPLRWSLRRDSSVFTARLLDAADSGVPVIDRYSFERPIVPERLAPGAKYEAPPTGGLYVAALGEFRASILIPPIIKDFSGMKCEPKIEVRDRTHASITSLLSFVRLWGQARLSGDIVAGLRQRLILRALTTRIWSILGDDEWGRKEEEFARGGLELSELRRAVTARHPRRRTAGREAIDTDQIFPPEQLKRLVDAPLPARGDAVVTFAKLTNELHLTTVVTSRSGVVRRRQKPWWIAEFALRMASDPMSIEAWSGEHFQEGLGQLRDAQTLARGVRFLVLAVDHLRKSSAASGELYAGWRWPS